MFSPPRHLLDYRQLYIEPSHFSHAAAESQHPLLIGHNCIICTECLYTKF